MPEPDPVYDVVVLVHIVGSVAGFGGLACTGVFAAVARRGNPANAATIRRYFNGRTNWVARTVYSVPILGLVLLAMSDGAFRLDEAWLVASVVLWVVAVVLAEVVIWPGERYIAETAGETGVEVDPPVRARTRQVCLRVMMAATVDVVVFGASLVIMLVKPGR